MALNSSDIKAQQAFDTIMTKAQTLRSGLQSQRTILAANGSSADVVMNVYRGVKTTRDIMSSSVGTPGLQAYARFVYDDPAKDFVADVNTAIAACTTLGTWIVNNFPKDANGYLLKDTFVNGEIVARTFTAAAMAGLVTQIDTLIAAL
jgi:thiaminase